MGKIVFNSVTRRFGSVVAVDDVSLTAEDGDFLVLLGPSGCGKTTLLRMLAGLLETTEGTIEVDGRDVTDVAPKSRDLAMVFQSYALYPHLDVAANLAFPLRTARTPRPEIDRRIAEVASTLEIDQLLDRRPKALSGGQRQRVALGRALVRRPRAFLMDEPLSNLDAKLRTATRQELAGLHRRLGATFVYVTHDQVEAMTMATKIAVLNQGRLEQVGTPDQVYRTPESTFVAGFIGSPPMNLLDVEARTVDGTVVLGSDGVSGSLWRGVTEPVELVLGVRAEHLRIIEPDGPVPTGVALQGEVVGIDQLGYEVLAYVAVGPSTVALRLAPESGEARRLAFGTPLRLHASLPHCHLFDRISGRRVEWQADPTIDLDDAHVDAETVTAG